MRHALGSILGAVPLALAASLAIAQVAPPAGSAHLFDLGADGVQIYACQAREGRPVWVFQAPEAALFEGNGRQLGTHGAGPHWVLADGSRVTGVVAGSAPAPVAGAIPWLLLRATPDQTPGQLRGVGFIRRFDTVGGAPPPGACTSGEVARMRYAAIYGFYAP
ncbi:DUF3455 domain-containing protein [Plastoroseomonas arctica]|uniref:DUF3455 domain-containing protein n=1 Tax=Plastoroseomonas arctica TaxID=1509237 RepID=A0AAF1KJE1_9PROT|nr:DUF3455 domain-containing protein [Plastoroseomonas arctica]MBR0654930.1 DUF3455 domain-containing protein [Plastoroseomonas arctica]